MSEKPTIEEPKGTEKPEVSAEDQAKAILEELGKFGIDSPEKVQNVAKASSEAGNLARILGETRQQNEILMREIQSLKNQPKQTDSYEYGEPINIKEVVRNELRGFYQEDILKPQVEFSNKIWSELSEVQSDEDYALVQSVWDKHWNNPNTQYKVQTGQTSPKKEYDKLVRTYYRQSMKKTYDALQGVMNQKAKPPHIETGDQTHVHMPTQSDETREKVDKIVKNSKGGDSDIEALVRTILPETDPMFRR